MNNKWLYNITGSDLWCSEGFDTKEEAIAAGRQEVLDLRNEGKWAYCFDVGKSTLVTSKGVNILSILKNVHEATTIDCGILGSNYLCNIKGNHIDELESDFNVVLFNWLKKYNYEPNFFIIDSIEKIMVSDSEGDQLK